MHDARMTEATGEIAESYLALLSNDISDKRYAPIFGDRNTSGRNCDPRCRAVQFSERTDLPHAPLPNQVLHPGGESVPGRRLSDRKPNLQHNCEQRAGPQRRAMDPARRP
jgi:hypothetical protein